jgi:hypothetical protein
MSGDILSKLRNRQSISFFKPYMNSGKRFFKIQLNKELTGICWQRFVSADRCNWIKLNECLSLHDIDKLLNQKTW